MTSKSGVQHLVGKPLLSSTRIWCQNPRYFLIQPLYRLFSVTHSAGPPAFRCQSLTLRCQSLTLLPHQTIVGVKLLQLARALACCNAQVPSLLPSCVSQVGQADSVGAPHGSYPQCALLAVAESWFAGVLGLPWVSDRLPVVVGVV